MTTYITFIYHTSGKFVRDENRVLSYVGGKVDGMPPMDIDLVEYFDLVASFKKLGYHEMKAMFWMYPGHTSLNSGLCPLHGDSDINLMCEAAMKASSSNQVDMHLYFEHPVLGAEDVEFVDPVVDENKSVVDDTANKTTVTDHISEEVLHKEKKAATPKKGARKKATVGEGIAVEVVPKEKKAATPKKGARKEATVGEGINEEVLPKEKKAATPKKGDRKKATVGEGITVADHITEEVLPKEKKRATPKKATARKKISEEVLPKGKKTTTSKKGARKKTTMTDEDSEEVCPKKKKVAASKEDIIMNAMYDSSGEDSFEVVSFEVDGYASNSEILRTPESTDDEANSRPTFPTFRESAAFGEVILEVGMKFDNLELFKNAVKDYNIALGREIKWKKNDKLRARAVCSVDGCPWLAFCSWSSFANTYQIKTIGDDHTCSRVFKNKAATGGWVAKKLEKNLNVQPNLRRKNAFEIMKEDFAVHLSEKKLSRALKQARLAVEGSEKAQYGMTWDYLGELLRSNPGSTAKMDVSPRQGFPPLFQRLYICLDACKKGFKAGCRPLIGLDGCFLKGYYGGQLLSAVAQDANKQYYVIAYAVVDAETKENWKWFLTLLLEDIGDHSKYGWNFISDQQKGLIPAIKEVCPGAHHRNCVVHIWKNFIKQWKDKELRGIVWECARCTTEPEFKAAMLRLKKINEKAWSYLNNIDPSAWVKAYFSHHPKCDNLTNNNCEVWNGKIVRYREKPILTMLEDLRCYLMRRMVGHKRILGSHKGKLPPVQQKQFEKIKKRSNFWTPSYTGDPVNETYEVHRHKTKVGVSLTHHTCTCQVWQLTGIPCVHAVAAIAHKNESPDDYVHQWLTMDALNATYEFYIQPVNSREYWTATDHPKPEPPKLKRPIGRPKKHRRKDVSEDMPGSQEHKLKKRFEVTCSKCGECGHYDKTCKGPAQPDYEKRKAAQIRAAQRRNAKKTKVAQEENMKQEQQSSANPPSPPQPPAVRPPPIRPRAQITTRSSPPPFYPVPSSAVGTPAVRPPAPPVIPFNPPTNAQNEGDSVAANMQFKFMPTPGYRPP